MSFKIKYKFKAIINIILILLLIIPSGFALLTDSKNTNNVFTRHVTDIEIKCTNDNIEYLFPGCQSEYVQVITNKSNEECIIYAVAAIPIDICTVIDDNGNIVGNKDTKQDLFEICNVSSDWTAYGLIKQDSKFSYYLYGYNKLLEENSSATPFTRIKYRNIVDYKDKEINETVFRYRTENGAYSISCICPVYAFAMQSLPGIKATKSQFLTNFKYALENNEDLSIGIVNNNISLYSDNNYKINVYAEFSSDKYYKLSDYIIDKEHISDMIISAGTLSINKGFTDLSAIIGNKTIKALQEQDAENCKIRIVEYGANTYGYSGTAEYTADNSPCYEVQLYNPNETDISLSYGVINVCRVVLQKFSDSNGTIWEPGVYGCTSGLRNEHLFLYYN